MINFSSTELAFIHAHLNNDVRQLLLRPGANPNKLDLPKLVAQIAARQKAKEKLPAWYANESLVFPPALSVEQASSESTAHYKASLVGGDLLADLTGGMGVDTWAFAKQVGRVIYVERQANLAELAAHNLSQLGTTNVTVLSGDGLASIAGFTEPVSWVYLDPHRRNEQGGKVVQLSDCEPDISNSETLNSILTKTERILVKTSPLLDIDSTVRKLNQVHSVHIVAVQGEVKEVLLEIGRQAIDADAVTVTAVNLTAGGNVAFQFSKGDERSADVQLSDPLQYIYEPNAAILKAGAFRLVASRYGLSKLAPNSHLYTSHTVVADFPGRIFSLDTLVKPDRKALQEHIPTMKANLTTRNFPQSVADLRKKLGLKEGGDTYVLATTLQNGDKRLLVTRKAI